MITCLQDANDDQSNTGVGRFIGQLIILSIKHFLFFLCSYIFLSMYGMRSTYDHELDQLSIDKTADAGW